MKEHLKDMRLTFHAQKDAIYQMIPLCPGTVNLANIGEQFSHRK
jgi:hypothetical protein